MKFEFYSNDLKRHTSSKVTHNTHMKKSFLLCLICVIFLLYALPLGSVFAHKPEQIEFIHNNKIFTYTLNENIKTNLQFDLNYEINKYNRFGTHKDRQKLLTHMLNIGLDKEIALEYLFPNLIKKLDLIQKNVTVIPKNAKLKVNTNTEKVFTITKEIVGVELDRFTLVNNICSNYINNKEMVFNLPLKNITPSIKAQDLKSFTNLRADFSTDISSSSADRKHNIKNALASLNKIEILPNQVFSFNKTVGRRTAENGYRQAKIIVNNEFVDGIGGGVCQVSSTLYNSALLAGLEIVEANKHSKQVSYIKQGFDAMVNFGSSDLKIKNNTNNKITIITNYSSSTARIRIYGAKPQYTYKLSNEVFNITEPKEEILYDEKEEYLDKVVYDNEYFYLKKPNRGMEIKSYRETYEDKNLIQKELLRHDKYKVQDAIKIYGNKKRADNICA